MDLTIRCDSAIERLLPDERSFHNANIYCKSYDFEAWTLAYAHGYYEPHYQVPAIPLTLEYDWVPSQPRPIRLYLYRWNEYEDGQYVRGWRDIR